MTHTIYKAGENPAVSLYNLWHMMLTAREPIVMQEYKSGRWDYGRPYPRVSYGDRRMGIGVYGFDRHKRPIIEYGVWYPSGLYPYLAVDADGNFMLLSSHGAQHSSIEGHTFLVYGWRAQRYVWAVLPNHSSRGKSIDTYDWRTGQPYLHEDTMRYGMFRNRRPWLMLVPHKTGWEMVAHPTLSEPEFQEKVENNRKRALRAYRRAQRKELGRLPNLSLRDGKTTLNNDAAVTRIAALLDVSQPAKARPMIRRAEEART